MNKNTLAKLLAWGQLALEAAFEVYKASGIPHTADAWFRFAGAFLIAIAVHHASDTSHANPNGSRPDVR